MKVANLIITLLTVGIISISANAQSYHLIYETDISNIIFVKDSIQQQNTKFEWVKGKHHILTLKNKKAITFDKDTVVTSIGYKMYQNNSYNSYMVFDRKKTRNISVMAYFNKKVNKVFINNLENIGWQKTDPLSPPVISELLQSTIKKIEIEKDTIIEWKAPEIDFYDEIKEINGYTCKRAYLNSVKRPLTIWYTEEINFNWCFSDYRYLIPGTVILIEHEGETTFELKELKPLDYDNLPIRKKVFDKLRKLK